MGYLYKHRPYATGLFSNSWELRFFTLAGSALQYYKSEGEATQHPRGHVDLQVGSAFGAVAHNCKAGGHGFTSE